MAVNWNHDIEAALAASKAQGRPILLDFTAAPS